MTPKELAQYPYVLRIAIQHITDKIVKVQEHQRRSATNTTHPQLHLVVMNQSGYQLRSVYDTDTQRQRIFILKDHHPVEDFTATDFYQASIRFLTLVQELETPVEDLSVA